MPSAPAVVDAELIEQYADFPLGGVDASVIALAERLDTPLVLTLDRGPGSHQQGANISRVAVRLPASQFFNARHMRGISCWGASLGTSPSA